MGPVGASQSILSCNGILAMTVSLVTVALALLVAVLPMEVEVEVSIYSMEMSMSLVVGRVSRCNCGWAGVDLRRSSE